MKSIGIKGVKLLGNIIKINTYIELKKSDKLSLQTIEEIIYKYKIWLKKTNREDKIENYEEFLQVH
jgi:D-mannonate dehydratase